MPDPIKMTLSFATRYNGVYLSFDEDDVEYTDEIEKYLDEVSDTLPLMTYEMARKFDCDLTDDQIDELISKAKEIVKPVLPNIEVTFEYDDHSS